MDTLFSDSNWVNAMHEELENFERNQVWVLVEPPPACNPIRTKWVFKNKQGEDGLVVRNKARLVAQGFCQKEGFAAHFPQAGGETHLQVSEIHP